MGGKSWLGASGGVDCQAMREVRFLLGGSRDSRKADRRNLVGEALAG